MQRPSLSAALLLVGPGDLSLSIATTIFDACIIQTLVPLACGAGTLLVPPGQQADAVVVADLIQHERPTILLAIVPALLKEYLLELQGRGAAGASVRELSCGGERVPPELAALAHQVGEAAVGAAAPAPLHTCTGKLLAAQRWRGHGASKAGSSACAR